MRGKRFLYMAAMFGHPRSAFQVGWRLLTEPDEPYALAEAARWLARAARQGCARSQNELARVLLKVKGRHNVRRAFILLLIARNNGAGDETAMGEARAMLSRGEQVRCLRQAKQWRPRPERTRASISRMALQAEDLLQQGDTRTALRLLRRAARCGDRDAQHVIGMMCSLCCMVPPHRARATRWLMRSARKKDAEALYNLGVLYYHDDADDQEEPPPLLNFSGGIGWQEEKPLQNALMFPSGLSPRRDPVRAYRFWKRAADAGLAAEIRSRQPPHLVSLKSRKQDRISLRIRQAALVCCERVRAELPRVQLPDPEKG